MARRSSAAAGSSIVLRPCNPPSPHGQLDRADRRPAQRELGAPVDAIAHPYGDVDPAIAHLVGACGFAYGLTCAPQLAELAGPLLLLPRVEVRGTDSLEQFAARLAVAE